MSITESGITLNFPDNNYFRLGECEGYRQIQHNFSEMDACWYDQANDTLFIIELKNWANSAVSEENDPTFTQEKIDNIKRGISDYRLNNLFKKSVDSVCMFMSVLLQKPHGLQIQACAPFSISNVTKIKLLSIISWHEADASYIANINTAYKSKFKPYAKLFNISTFIVLTKAQAIQKFSWIN